MAESCDPKEKECQEKQAVAWPSKSAEVEVIGPNKKSKTVDPFTGEEITEEYSPIRVTYTYENASGKEITKSEKGWIEASFVRLKQEAPTKRKPEPKSNDPLISLNAPKAPPETRAKECDPEPPPIKKSDKNDLSKLKRAIEVHAYDAQVELLMEKVGKCIKAKPELFSSSGIANYDLFVLPEIKAEPVPRIEKMVDISTNSTPKIVSVPMTRDDLINIDAVARTLYAEVAVCFKKGLQHPLAVSRVIDNRNTLSNPKNNSQAEIKRAKMYEESYAREKHAPGTPILTKIVTSPSQFNVWMGTHKKEKKDKTFEVIPNPALGNALCPLPEKYKKIEEHSKKKTIPYQVSVWKNSVRIATELVLHNHAFKDRFPKPKTKKEERESMTSNHVFYTSHMTDFYNYKRVYPKIEGYSLDPKGCVQIWKDPKIEVN